MKLSALEKNRIAGARLDYVMQLKGKRDVDLINYILENTDFYVSAPMMSQYLSGKKHIPNHIAIEFSKYLDIDAGYLLGLDGYNTKNDDYRVYQSIMRLKSEVEDMQDFASTLDRWLDFEGYSITSIYKSGRKVTKVQIKDRIGNTFMITSKELNKYTKDIEKYIKARTKQLIKTQLKEGDAND